MFNQSISIIEFSTLYNILKEIENIFKFNIKYYKSLDDFINEARSSDSKFFNSITIVNKKNHKIFALKEINKNNILNIIQIAPGIKLNG